MEPLITIYTQCYNREEYIEKCILSVVNQTYKNFEYYICNHGSTDNTQQIIDKYAAEDDRIKSVFYPNNERGFYPDFIKGNGKGKYFAMLDSDDWWDENHLEKLVSFSEENELDMCMCGIESYTEATGEYGVLRALPETLVFDISDINKHWYEVYDFLRSTWGKLISMEAVKKADYSTYKKNAVSFTAEDTAFTLANLVYCKKIAVIPDKLLVYRIHESSISAKYKKDLVDNAFNIYVQSMEMLRLIGDDTEASRDYLLMVLIVAINYAVDMLIKSNQSEYEIYKEILRIVKIPYVEAISEVSGFENTGFGQLINAWLEKTGRRL